jgi:glutaredoxin 3
MDQAFRDKLFTKAGTKIVPQFWVDDEYVGGYEKVLELEESGQLDRILQY